MLNIRNELCVEFGWFGLYSYRLGRVQFNVTGTHKKTRRVKFILTFKIMWLKFILVGS